MADESWAIRIPATLPTVVSMSVVALITRELGAASGLLLVGPGGRVIVFLSGARFYYPFGLLTVLFAAGAFR